MSPAHEPPTPPVRYAVLVAPVAVCSAVSLAIGAAIAFSHGRDPWVGWTLGTDGLTAMYCEANRLGEAVRQPANSWSNLAFLAVSVAMTERGIRDLRARGARGTPLSRQPAFSLVFGACAALVAIGSFGFHASITWPFQRLDMGATYTLVLAFIAYLVHRIAAARSRVPASRIAWICIAAWLASTLTMFVTQFGLRGKLVLPALLCTAVGLGIFQNRTATPRVRARPMAAAAVCVLAGIGVWQLDFHKILCDPHGPWQWHALWHVSTAAAAWLAYEYFDAVA